MIVNTRSLKQHLAGHNVPRHIVGKVLAELANLSSKEITEVFQGLDELKARLRDIAASEQTLTRIQAALVERSYYVLKGSNVTLNHQMVKERDAIQSSPNKQWESFWPTIVRGARDFGKVDRLRLDAIDPIYMSLWNKYSSSQTATAIQDEQHRINHVVEKSQKRLQVELQQWSELPAGLKDSPVWDRVFTGIHLLLVQKDGTGNNLVGQIGVTQEPGMKLRLFASPYLMYQVALDPLKRRLQKITSGIPQDCHQDQEEGAQWAKRQLMNNHRVYSYDLSSATHRFPWAMQLRLLNYLEVPKPVLDLYEHVSKGTYRIHDNETVAWTAGQPLGTAPSFFAFSLAHHALVRGICRDLNTSVDCYRILGDDIVIANDRVAKRYEAAMTAIGSVINHTKSIVSKDRAEFAGYQITANELFRTGKLRQVNQTNWLTYATGWANRDDLARDARGIVTTLEQFNSFTPFADSVMDPVTHRFIELQQANAAAKNLDVPDTVAIHDFATTVASYIPQRKDRCRDEFYGFYSQKMRQLGQEIISYLTTSEWVMNVASPSHRITSGVRELLLELSECPTQCMPLWAEPIMAQRGGRPTFMRVRRTLIQLATSYRLTKPAAWLIDGNKFAAKLYQWHMAAEKLEAEDKLLCTVLELEKSEFMHRRDNLTKGSPSNRMTQVRTAKVTAYPEFNFDYAVPIW